MILGAFGGREKKKTLIAEEITSSRIWSVPVGVARIEVMIFGGGGGRMAFGEFDVMPGMTYNITIGSGGTSTTGQSDGNSGGVTSFGSVLAAYGGSRGMEAYGKGGDGGAGGCGPLKLVTDGNNNGGKGGNGYGAGGGGAGANSSGGVGAPGIVVIKYKKAG